jgi:hypothetical protein
MPAFAAKGPDFDAKVRLSFESLTLMRTVGARLQRVAPAQGERMLARGRVIRDGQ